MKIRTINQLLDLIRRHQEQGSTQNGSTRYRAFMPLDRYVVDYNLADGWEQYDTAQDAAYFGVWVNPKERKTLTYAEGDWCLVECANAAMYNAEIKDANAFHEPGFMFTTIDREAGAATRHVQDRQQFFIEEAS